MMMRMPVRAPGPTTKACTPRCFSHISSHCCVSRGTTEAMPTSSIASSSRRPCSEKNPCSRPAISSLVRWRTVARRHSLVISPAVRDADVRLGVADVHGEQHVRPPRRGRGRATGPRREGAHRDDVHAGLGQLAHALEAHAAGDLDESASRDERHGLADRGRVHVVEQDDRDAGGESLLELRRACRPRPRGCARAPRRRAQPPRPPRTPPAAATWLSLIIAPSNRPKRCGVPPPCTTACFSRARRPGVVLRVAAMRAVVPLVSATYRAVSVATPERRQRKLRPVRSAARMLANGPRTLGQRGAGDERLAVGHDRLRAAAPGPPARRSRQTPRGPTARPPLAPRRRATPGPGNTAPARSP